MSSDINDLTKERLAAISIIAVFERFLNDKNITIPGGDREGLPTEARIYGSDYYLLEDTITDLIMDMKKE
jgi:hypothetical protein